jgi:predicted DNA-binding antitoxin AbrB/MazE fold protein
MNDNVQLGGTPKILNVIGSSTREFIPTDDNVLVVGKARNSILALTDNKPESTEFFTFYVEGFGKNVTDLSIGDCVKLMPGSEGRIILKSNDKSFEQISSTLRKLTSKEREEFFASIEKQPDGRKMLDFHEYFVVKRYAVVGIFADVNDFRNLYNRV